MAAFRGTSDRLAAATTAVVVACAAVALATGVDLGEVVRWLAYESYFILLPGVLAVRAVDPRASALRLAALGWLGGILLSCAAFALCAKVGARPVFFAYPLVVVAACAWSIRRPDAAHANADDAAEHAVARSNLAIWGLVAVVLAALVISWPLRIEFDPLPRDVTSAVAYDRDTLYYLGLAADAERHGVPGYAGVSGERLDFPDLAFIDAGARAYATGLDPSVVMLRLQRLSLIVAAALAFALAGAAIGGRVAAAPVTAGLALAAGELDIDADSAYTSLFAIPPYIVSEEQIDLLLGSAMFAAALVLLWEVLRGPVPRARWALALAFAVGAAESKGAAAPVLFGGGVLLVTWAFLADRSLMRRALQVLALGGVAMAWLFFVVVRGSAYGVTVQPLAIFEDLVLFQQQLDALGDGVARAVGWVVGVPAWLLGLFGGLICGVLWALLLIDERERRRLFAWPLACLAAGAGPLFLLDQIGAGQRDFAWFGVYGAIPVSAAGLVALCARRPRVTAAAAVGVALVLLIVSAAQPGTTPFQRYTWAMAAVFAVPLLAAAAVLRPLGWNAALAVLTAGLVAAAALDRPIDVKSRLPVLGERGTPPPTEIRFDGELVRGYTWIAANAPEDAVLALAPIRTGEPNRYFILTALARRRAFLEGWGNSRRSADLGFARVLSGEVQPFPEREALNRRAFAGDRAALAELRNRYGVRWLVVDKLNSEPVDAARFGRPLFDNRSVAVYSAG